MNKKIMKIFFSELIIQISIFFSFFLQVKNSDMILLNLSYYYKEDLENPSTMYLETFSQLGSPKMDIFTYIRTDKKENLFAIYEVIYSLKDSEISNYYNYTNSNTFQNVSCIGHKIVKSQYDIQAREKFYFNVYNNKTKLTKEIEVDDLNFILGVDLFPRDKVYFLNIGLPVVDESTISERFKFDFILQLKQKKIIDSYDWFILFDDKFDKGDDVIKAEELPNLNPILVIGDSPHNYNSKKFYESQLLKAYSNLYYWSINFKDIYLYTYSDTGEKVKTSTYVETVEFYLDDIMIYGPMFYLNIVKNQYFSKYTACKYVRDPEFKFYCEKSEDFGINELKLFPILYLDNVFLNYTFELTYKELFIEMNGKYHFLVTENEEESWSIGYSLLKKYQFVFNQDSRTVGFYNPNLPKDEDETTDEATDEEKKEEEGEKEKENKSDDKKENEKEKGGKKVNETELSIELIIIIICGSAIVFIALGILIGKFIFKKMKSKKRVNELEENFDYFGTQENVINE